MAASIVQRSQWLRAVLDFAFPPQCLGCQSYYEGKDSVCPHCLERIDRYEHPLCLTCTNPIEHGTGCGICGETSLPLFAHGNYVDPLKEIVVNYKFRGITTPAKLFAKLVAERFGEQIVATNLDSLIPIPLHPTREYYRGYNQAALFARELGRFLGLHSEDGHLARVRKRKPQARLREAQRAGNIRGAFKAVGPGESRRVCLVDDVVTSGATAREAASVLNSAGYEVLAVIAIAHGR